MIIGLCKTKILNQNIFFIFVSVKNITKILQNEKNR